MARSEGLKKLNLKIKNCKKCDLGKTRKNAVPGEGLLSAKIIILGQAPGAKENETGEPFVGRAGQFLDELEKKGTEIIPCSGLIRINRLK